MGSENRGFIVSHYTTFNGTKLTRQELSEKILKLLDSGGSTCGNLARTLKVTNQAIYNVTHNMIQEKILTKFKDKQGIYVYRKVKECLLADLFYPTPQEVEKMFKIKGRQVRKAEQGTSKSSGRGGVIYNQSLYEGIEW